MALFFQHSSMKTQILILALGILACNDSAGNKQPDNDSAANSIQDTPSQPATGDTTTMKGDTNTMKDTTTLAGNWFLQPVLTSDTATGTIPRLQFNLNSRRFTGHTGCNNMSGTFNFTDTSMSFNKDIVSTKMACVGYNEKAFLENLLRTNTYKLENGMLILMFGEQELSRWTRKVMPKPVSNRT
jgi:heat shock protein HslJ